MSRRAATMSTRARGPSWVSTMPSGCQSSTACSSGIGTCSCAWKRTAAPSSLLSFSGGRSMVRTTMRGLATPIRTRRSSLLSLKRVLMISATPSGSMTSPSRTMPGASVAEAARVTVTPPLTWTSAAET